MLNSKVTDKYKVNEFDGSYRENVPYHFDSSKPIPNYDKEPMGYAGVINKARPPPNVYIGGKQELRDNGFKMTPF